MKLKEVPSVYDALAPLPILYHEGEWENEEDGEEPVKLLWSVGHYDGPRSGVCEYKGEKCWFKCYCDDRDTGRMMLLVRLTTEQYRLREEEHRVWQAYAGDHTTFTFNTETHRYKRGESSKAATVPGMSDEEKQKYPPYIAWKKWTEEHKTHLIQYEDNEVIGWFVY